MISNCIFTWAITRQYAWSPYGSSLWIDFKLYFYVSNHKMNLLRGWRITVVNWFQIVFLREQSQATSALSGLFLSCELISNCIFTWAITSLIKRWCFIKQLWIDFKLYFYVSNHKDEEKWKTVLELWIDFKLYFYVSNHKIYESMVHYPLVVNWFQIVFLREQSQAIDGKRAEISSCELISNCIFTWAITRKLWHEIN